MTEAEEAWKQITPPHSGVAEDEEVAPVIPSEGVLAKVKWKAIRASTYIVGVLIAIGLVIVGLETVFDVNAMFPDQWCA